MTLRKCSRKKRENENAVHEKTILQSGEKRENDIAVWGKTRKRKCCPGKNENTILLSEKKMILLDEKKARSLRVAINEPPARYLQGGEVRYRDTGAFSGLLSLGFCRNARCEEYLF